MTPPLDAWGLSGTPEPLIGGHRNTVLRVGVHVLKTTRRGPDAIAWLLPVLDAAEAAGFRVPRPIRSAQGALVVEGWTCELFLPGTPTEPPQIAPMIDSFHAGTQTLGQRSGFASARHLLLEDRGGDVDLSTMPTPLVTALRAAWGAVAEAPQGVIHGDLGTGNILRDAEGRYALIDWDEARRDHLLYDYVPLGRGRDAERHAAEAWEIASCWHVEPERARALARTFLSR